MTIPAKLFTAFIPEIIGRRWTITYCLAGAIPGLALMGLAHRAGEYATGGMTARSDDHWPGTVLSPFPAVLIYLSEQFPTTLRGRGHFFGGGDRAAFCRRADALLLGTVPVSRHDILLGTIAAVVEIGACAPVVVSSTKVSPAGDGRQKKKKKA